MSVTLKDVAREAGYSVTTTSRALNDHADVNEQTRQHIKAIARRLGYRPNLNARQLQSRRAQALGFVIPTEAQRLNEPFFMEFLSAVASEAAQHDYDLLVSAHAPDVEEEDTYRRLVQSGRVGGVLLVRVRWNDPRVTLLDSLQVPCVLFGRTGDDIECAWIDVDGEHGMRAATEHLLDLGHRRIAFISGPAHYHFVTDRQRGYDRALQAAGHPVDPTLVRAVAHMTEREGYEVVRELLLLPEPPTAFLAVTDLVAVGAMRALHEVGHRVGQDVAVVGFDGLALSAYTSPPLTTVSQPIEEIGRRLVRMLLRQIERGGTVPESELVPPTLLVRESSTGEPHPADYDLVRH